MKCIHLMACSASLLQSSVSQTLSFRNHSKMLIWSSKNISYMFIVDNSLKVQINSIYLKEIFCNI